MYVSMKQPSYSWNIVNLNKTPKKCVTPYQILNIDVVLGAIKYLIFKQPYQK